MRLLHEAEFSFAEHKVVFDGATIRVYGMADGTWDCICELPNRWVSIHNEDSISVMGRKYKPRITDASAILDLVLQTGGAPA